MIKHTLTALALTATLAAPAQASNDDIIKGIFATIIIHEVLNKTQQQHVEPTPQIQYPSERSAPGYYDSSRSCRVDVHRGDYYTTRTVYNCQGAILEHESWPSN